MGNWNVSIEGVGIHQNGREDDVEQMAKKFVEHLRDRGHFISKATVTVGGKVDVLTGENMLTIEKK